MDENINQNQPQGTGQPTVSGISKDARTWAMFCHLAGLCGFIPFGNIIAPLILWQMKKAEFPFVDGQGKEALNFQISVTIYFLACIPLIAVCGIGVFLMPVVGIFDLVFLIIASIKANNGEDYRYPLSIRLVK